MVDKIRNDLNVYILGIVINYELDCLKKKVHEPKVLNEKTGIVLF